MRSEFSKGDCRQEAMESLKQAAIHLIKDNIDLKSLLNEVSIYSFDELQASPDDAAITVIMDTLQYWSDTTSQSVPLVASCYALEQLRLLGNHSNDTCEKQHFFTKAQKKEFSALCEFIQSLVQKKFFDRRHFVCGVYDIISSVPIEMFWILFKSRLITIQDLDYTSDKVSEKFWEWLDGALGHICAASPSDCVDVQRNIVQDISVALVQLAYQEDEYNQYALLAMECLKGLIFRSHDLKDDCTNSYSVITALRHSHLTRPQHLRDILVQVMKEYFSTSSSSTIMTAVEAFSLQELWKFASLSKNVVNFYSEVCEVLDISDCGILLSVAIDCDKMAWKNVLEFVSSLINVKANITDELLTKFLKEQVTISLANCLSHQLQSTLLLARQCSSEGSHLFPSYYNWLQDVMGGGASDNALPLTKRSAQFLIKVLTDMIPHETGSYLQLHAKFLRKHLSKHKNSVDHFMTVAMTRLKDLGVGDKEWSEGHELGKTLSLSNHDDVEHALKLFEQSKDVPSFVMRMSILQPQKFINLFLPVLLAPRVQPNVLDTREKFIQKLNQLKKIPVSMLNLYETECKRQRSKDLNKSTISLGDNSEITLALHHLMDCVKHNLSGNVSPSLSVLSSAITAACHHHGDSDTTLYSDDHPEQLDLNNPCLYKWQIELVDVIISTLCSSVMEIYLEIEYKDCDPLHRFLWLNYFLEMFSSHTILHRPWFVRLWELLFIQGDDLLESHITGLAVLLAHMTSSQCAYQRLQINRLLVATISDQRSYHCIKGLAQYGEYLLEYLGANSKEWPCNSLSLLSQMLRHTLIMKHHLPQTALVKFQYFHSYLSFCHKSEREATVSTSTPATKRPKTAISDVLRLADALIKEPEVVKLLSDNKLTLKEWLLLELSHSPVEDQQSFASNNKYAYRCHMLQGQLSSRSSNSTSCDPNVALHDSSFSHDHNELFTALLTTLIQLYSHKARANQCWEDGLSLLQDQTLSLPLQSNPTLPLAIKAALKDEISSDAARCCFRIVSVLPYHLFFCNDPSELTDMKQSFDVLQTCWAPHLLCGNYVLPFDITRFLYKGLLVASRNFSGCIVSALLDHCPLLLSSFLVWWEQLKHLRCRESKLALFTDSLSSIINRPSATSEQNLMLHNNLPMVVGVCMYHNVLDNRRMSDDFLCKLNILFHKAECKKQALVILLYCAVYNCGWHKSDVNSKNNTVHLIETLIYTDPELLCPLFGLDDFSSGDGLASFLRQFQNHFPTNFDLINATLFVLYFRLVSMFKSSLLLKLLQCHEVFRLTLDMYGKYSAYKDTVNADKLVLSLNDISLITTVFQSIIQLLPDHLLKETSARSHVSDKVKSYCKREMHIRNLC